jgi:hypothetical protein
MISENPGFLERRLTRISILGREVRRRHGTRRATRPAPLARGPWRRVRATLLTRPDPTGRRNGYSSRREERTTKPDPDSRGGLARNEERSEQNTVAVPRARAHGIRSGV